MADDEGEDELLMGELIRSNILMTTPKKRAPGNPRYRSGRSLEYLIKDKLEKQGYFVVRAAGSHGVADLVAINFSTSIYRSQSELEKYGYHEILFISCKIPMYAPPAERKALLDAAERYGAVAMITKKNPKGQWELQRLDS